VLSLLGFSADEAPCSCGAEITMQARTSPVGQASRIGSIALNQLTTTACVAVLCGACGAPTPLRPIRSISYLPTEGVPTTAVLLMPGRRSRAPDFESSGFVSAVRNRNLNVELVAVDAHLGYYLEQRYQSLPDIVEEDVVQPLLARGRQRLWLVGTSLGAFGSVAYAKKHPECVAGILLMGAYLGEEAILEDIEHAGGLARWMPTPGVGIDYETRTWDWFKGYLAREPRPNLYLAYARRDPYARASVILTPALAGSRILVDEAGGHDFDTWTRLWGRFLDAHGQDLLQTPAARCGLRRSNPGSSNDAEFSQRVIEEIASRGFLLGVQSL
jgi:pimeloyl-ACP methyl ester carboxylesterase